MASLAGGANHFSRVLRNNRLEMVGAPINHSPRAPTYLDFPRILYGLDNLQVLGNSFMRAVKDTRPPPPALLWLFLPRYSVLGGGDHSGENYQRHVLSDHATGNEYHVGRVPVLRKTKRDLVRDRSSVGLG